ncbi:VOC family protein [Jeotgalibacillus proteolyticus]|uniref:VOC family protein n=1 Tax=Jeotgalibacillus proteolyticus TaxID=2082395 RepID=A0A2S5G8R6_9BACL|nr:VOC family protein [Jeotgalibacillus proteolyticus]PPA69390.1 VOC family protein [Jeotgalibacillus proteolyticus]
MKKSFIEQLHYCRIPVRNLEQSAQWYEEVVGLQLVSMTDDPFAIMRINEGSLLLVLVPAEDDTFSHFTTDNKPAFSLGFTSPALKEFHQHLQEKGVKVGDITEDKGHAYFHFYDPSGNQLQVHW